MLEDLRRGLALRHVLVEDSERSLAGLVNGVLWLGGTLSLLPLLFFGSITPAHRALLIALAVGGVGLGVASLALIDWRRVPGWFFLAFSLISLAMIAMGILCSGGDQSPARSYLLISILFTAWFYPPRIAAWFLALNVLVNAAPVIYDPTGGSTVELLRLFFMTSVFILVGGSIICGRAFMWLHRVRADRLAAQDRAMRAITAAVVEGADPDEMYRIAAREVSELTHAAAAVIRLERDDTVTLMGAWPPDSPGADRIGARFPMRVRSPVREVIKDGVSTFQASMVGSPLCDTLGFRAGMVAPIILRQGQPFVIVVPAEAGPSLEADLEQLTIVCEPIATAIQSLHDRERLAEQAASDALTGLANHRVFNSELVHELDAAVEAELPLSVAVLDVDDFKQINDAAGHEFGDATLVRLADALRSAAGARDTISRTGGDEFAWLMPGVCARDAYERVEAAREIFQRAPGDHKVTISVGICDIAAASDPAHLTRLADGALYWSKAHGRAQTQVYDPDVVEDLSETERANRLARSQTLVGLRALARAIDAKDPVTSQHSERVADLASRLARVRGWPEQRVALLRDAALVHDVGKLAVPDALLTKPGDLTDRERLQMSEHVELSVRIATGVLSDEQLEWINTHHERPDGNGYPRGIGAGQLPEGGELLAVANAFDAMTSGRGYSRGLSLSEALEECRLRAGTQFAPAAVDALEQAFADTLDWSGTIHVRARSEASAAARRVAER